LYLQGARMRLRPTRIEDAAAFQPWINDPEIQRLIGGRGRQFSLPAQEDFIREHLVNDGEHGFALAIEATDVDGASRRIGNLELRKLEAVERRGEVGTLIRDRSFSSRGSGEDAMRRICGTDFTTSSCIGST
jgi:RimJ/RimL family protein N-acetyltransferase